jgi:hypothetical protein
LVSSSGTKRHQGPAGIRDAPAALRLIAKSFKISLRHKTPRWRGFSFVDPS